MAFVDLTLCSGVVLIVAAVLVLWFATQVWQSDKALLDTPIKLKVKIRKLGESDYYATVYMDRRTGAITAPTDASERILELNTGEELTETVLGAPHYKPLYSSFGSVKNVYGVQMLMATYIR